MAELKTGDQIPDFDLPASSGENVRPASLKGCLVVLFFYPQDGSKSCTTEVSGFNALAGAFRSAGVKLFGVSPDSLAAHQRFGAKLDLQVTLISDEARQAIDSFGLWIEKSMYGRTFWGVERATLLIDKTGKIARIWHKVRVKGHAEEVLAAARSLAGG